MKTGAIAIVVILVGALVGGLVVLEILDINIPSGTAIRNSSELASMSERGTYYLDSDIDLSDEEWVPINFFNGHFDGNGHKIIGLRAPLFNECGGEIKNLSLESVNIEGSSIDSTGSVANKGYCSLDKITVTGIVKGIANVGGIIGKTSSSITNCTNYCDVIGQYNVGGICGVLQGNILSGCENYGQITATGLDSNSITNVGGIAGYYSDYFIEASDRSSISDCVNHGVIISTSLGKRVGGVAGHVVTYHHVSNLHNEGLINSRGNSTGGIIGGLDVGTPSDGTKLTISVTGLANTGSVISTGDYTGGIFGFAYSNKSSLVMQSCAVDGKISGMNYVGGYVGDGNLTINGLSNNLEILGSSYIGGIVGNNDGLTKDCSNTGSIKASGHHAGGIAGQCGVINGATNTGSVTAKGVGSSGGIYLGGIAGQSGTLNNATNNGSISTTVSGKYIGGIAGYAIFDANSSNNTNTSAISSTGNCVGGIIGYLKTSSGSYQYTLSQSSNTGTVTSTGDYVGGMVGYIYDTTSSVLTRGSVDLFSDTNNSNVTGNDYVGGIVGYGGGSNCTYLVCSGTIAGKTNVDAIGTITGNASNNDTAGTHVVIV